MGPRKIWFLIFFGCIGHEHQCNQKKIIIISFFMQAYVEPNHMSISRIRGHQYFYTPKWNQGVSSWQTKKKRLVKEMYMAHKWTSWNVLKKINILIPFWKYVTLLTRNFCIIIYIIKMIDEKRNEDQRCTNNKELKN